MTLNRIDRRSDRLWLTTLMALSAGINFFPLKLMFGVEFLFGGIFAMLVLLLYGPVWGTAAAAAASLPSLFLWSHPYAIAIFTAEAAFLGLLGRSRPLRNLVLHDMLYWLLAGIPLTWIFYRGALGIEPLAVMLMTLKLSVNGLSNALAAALCHSFGIIRNKSGAAPAAADLIPLQHLLFRIMLALVLVSSLLQLAIDSRRHLSAQEANVDRKLRHVLDRVDLFVNLSGGAASYIDTLRTLSGWDREIGYILTDTASGEAIYTANALPLPAGQAGPSPVPVRMASASLSLSVRSSPEVFQLREYQNSVYYMQRPLQADSRYLVTVQLQAAPYWNDLFKEEGQGFAIVFGMIAATALLSLPLSRRLTLPLSRLASTTSGILDKIDSGKTIRWPSSNVQEIHALAANFAALSGMLQAYIRRLKEHNLTLEQSVAERTDELDRTRSMLTSILSAMRDMVWSVTYGTRELQYINQACEMVTGLSSEALSAAPTAFARLLHPDDRQAVARAYRTLLRTGAAQVQFRIVRASGETGWLQTKAWIVRDKEGRAKRIDGVTSDITESRLAQDALKRSEEQYRSVVNHVKEVIFQTDAEGLWTFLNPAWTECLGFSIGESLGTPYWHYVHPDDRKQSLRLFSQLIERKKDFCRHEVRYITKDGSFRWIEVYARLTLDAGGRIIGTSGTLNDVTARVQAEKEVEQQARDLLQLSRELAREKAEIEAQRNINRSILETTREGMMLCGADGTIQFANDRMKSYFRFDPREDATVRLFFRRRAERLDEPIEPLLEDVAAFLEERESPSFYRRLTYKDSLQTVYYELYASPVTGCYGTAGDSCLFVFRDRTEEEKRETMKDHLISCLSHELCTPLTSILGYMEILLNRSLSADRRQTYMQTVFRESLRLSRLVDDFLDLQRMELGNQKYFFVPVHVARFITELVEEWKMQERAAIELRLPDCGDMYVYADTDRLKQVLGNLIGNAIKYSPEPAQIELTVRAQNGIVAIDVADAGLGIPDEDKEKVFEKFYRVDRPDRRNIAGSGLGLAIAREIMEAHQGEITFTSTYGEGSTFTVWLQEYAVPHTDGAFVLIEDDEEMAPRLEELFTRSGAPCLRFRSFEEALLAMRVSLRGSGDSGGSDAKRAANGGLPLLCVAGLIAGGVMNGWEFLAELARDPQLCGVSVLFTAAVELGASDRGTDMKRLIQKPLSAERLAAAGRSMLLEAEAAGRQAGRGTVYVFPQQDPAPLIAQLSKLGVEADEVSAASDCVWVRPIAGSDESR